MQIRGRCFPQRCEPLKTVTQDQKRKQGNRLGANTVSSFDNICNLFLPFYPLVFDACSFFPFAQHFTAKRMFPLHSPAGK
jgi:hypothetical protein